MRLYPHRTASADSVSWRGWWVERDGNRSLLPQVLAGWDYASDETVGTSVALDPEEIRESCGLGVQDLELLVTADCPMVQQRFIAREPLADYQSGATVDIPLRLPPGQVAGSIKLCAHLVLARTTDDRGDRTAYLRGSRIQSCEPVIVWLEGDSGRFPTEAASFSELGLGDGPWTVLTTYEDLTDSFMGGIRLLINVEHAVGRLALDHSAGPRVSALLRADTMRLLVASAARRIDDLDWNSLEEDSIGYVLDTMCQLFFHASLKTVVRLHREDPAQFELLLHDRLRPLDELVK